MRIALATCATRPVLAPNDRPLLDAFAQRGVDARPAIWDDPFIEWPSFHACLIRSTWDYAERRAEFVVWAERVAACTRLINGPAIIRWNTDKRYLLNLEAAGVPIVPTVLLDAGLALDLSRLLGEHGWSEAVIKPAIGATARETLRVTRRDAFAGQAHLDRLLKREAMLIQPFLRSILTEGEVSLVFVDGRFSHAVRKRAVAGDYRVQDEFGGTIDGIEPDEGTVALARRVIDASPGRPVYARVDFVRDDVGALRVIELELTEPMLYFHQCPAAAAQLVRSVLASSSPK
jgi:glutathione synthase/RimK-type ligase-like ATP-grasp enzyme